jgi:hypothetical protein
MQFNIYTKEGFHFIQYFHSIDELLASMLANPKDVYHRIDNGIN